MRWAWLGILAVLVANPAVAQDKWLRSSLGYAFSQYLESGGGNAPWGAYLSIASIGRSVGLEGELAYHSDYLPSEFGFGEKFTLHTITLGLGPRFELGSARVQPFLHVLGGYASAFFRLGADLQVFFDDGESLKTIRVIAGFSF